MVVRIWMSKQEKIGARPLFSFLKFNSAELYKNVACPPVFSFN
jgi:hypothetical protein